MFKVIIPIVMLSLLANKCYTQNMVPNGSFETTNIPYFLPKTFIPNYLEFENSIKEWRTPHYSTPDLLHPGFKKIIHIGRPQDGNVMVGLFTVARYFEDVQVKLKSPTKKGKTYYVEFWIARSNNIFNPDVKREQFISSNFGVLFTKKAISEKLSNVSFIGQPQIHCPEKLYLTTKWKKVSGLFYPDEEYEYITIGQFEDTTNQRPNVISGYVLLDNVKVEELTSINQVNDVVENIKIGTLIPLESIFFKEGESIILKESEPSLSNLYNFLNKNSSLKICLNGHTDNKGSRKFNLKLSQSRAKSIYDYLVKKGIESHRMNWKGFGESHPKFDNSTLEGRKKNRRVEIEIISKN